MTTSESTTAKTSPLQQAARVIQELNAQLVEARERLDGPIAIVGMACRFPGDADSPERFWQLLHEGRDAVTEVPKERWSNDEFHDPDPDAPGKMVSRHGAFLRGVDRFDREFFGISENEAINMDPQQRMMAELTKEALDDAGIPQAKLEGSNTGVFVGVANAEYAREHLRDNSRANIYSATSTFNAIVANRISYLYDLHGPSYTVDAVCSASLLAVHVGVASLRRRECNVALVGGSGLLLEPEGLTWFSKLGVLSTDGKCRAFADDGKGIVLGEGIALLVLKRLRDALADGDPIHAVIRGTGVAQDGRSNGMTAPTKRAQIKMLRDAYRDARIDPRSVQYVEAHGTGTVLGDPIEAAALGEVLGQGRAAADALRIGSVKTNIGHLQMVGGLAGLIKVVLAMKHAQLPASLHFDRPNARIPFDELRLQVQFERGDWPTTPDGTLRAGVTSLSFGGTNVHVVLESAPCRKPKAQGALEGPLVLPLSARTRSALERLAANMADHVAGLDGTALRDVLHTASVRRDHFEHRLSVVGSDAAQLATSLRSFVQGELPSSLHTGKCSDERPRVVFVFSGQGGQWLGMGRTLLDSDPVFCAAIERCEAALAAHVDWSLRALLHGGSEQQLSRMDVIQPVLMAIQVALVDSLRVHGVRPDAVVGHSMGEVAAAYAAGALTLDDAALVIATRSRLIQSVAQRGEGMALVALSALDVERIARELGHGEELFIAAENGPLSTVLSGPVPALDALVSRVKGAGGFASLVQVPAACHSERMRPLADELARTLASIRPTRANVPLFSTVTAARIDGEQLDAAYWVKNLCQKVEFRAAIEAARAAGFRTFLEVGPHPVLVQSIEQCLGDDADDVALFSCWERERDEREALASTLARLYVHGYPLDWSGRLQGGQSVALPRYPWNHRSYWLSRPGATSAQRASPASELEATVALPALLVKLASVPERGRRQALLRELRRELKSVLSWPDDTLPPVDRGFFELGMTSIQAVELRDNLQRRIGRKLPSTFTFQSTTLSAVAEALLEKFLRFDEPPELPAAARSREPAPRPALSSAPRALDPALDDAAYSTDLAALFDRELARLEAI